MHWPARDGDRNRRIQGLAFFLFPCSKKSNVPFGLFKKVECPLWPLQLTARLVPFYNVLFFSADLLMGSANSTSKSVFISIVN